MNLLEWIKKHPQRTAGMIQVAAGSLMASLPTLELSKRSLAVTLMFFGLVQAVFGYLKSQSDDGSAQ
jgi:hypothetical protein